ncbi:MAG: aminotransferase class I/II-fold pyridoxal phosphate-dependent enzyme [Lachnospiraceae bacterium]|nr:aminotransferase class I/II-fold pyridoxal phosphate-dependent enzyme [Lachnospiraceae bacterium]
MGILFDKLTAYSESDYYPYHMPGHKRQPANKLPTEWTAMDITEIEGFDNLHQPQGILQRLQEKAAKAYGAEESFYLVNGSTSGILSAVSATVPFGGELIIARNCHKSVYHAAYLRHLQLHYIYPEVMESFDLCEAVTAEQVKRALQEHPHAAAVLIVSPTYEGRIADVQAIAKVVHEKGLPLIVDEAHGAHLGFVPEFATNSARLGADIVINSVHKTLPAMTQTALLHVNGQAVDRERLKRFLHIYQTSSPSYVLMSSIEVAVDIAAEGLGFVDFSRNWRKLLSDLSGCSHLKTLPDGRAECAEKQHDIGKLIISVKGTELSGQQLYDILLEEYHLQVEMVCETYVLCMFTLADTEEGYNRLTKALKEIDSRLQEKQKQEIDKLPRLKIGKALYEAWEQEKESIPLAKAEGRLAGEFVNLYPPGTPIAVPGECFTKEAITMLEDCLAGGLTVQGITGEGYVVVLKGL